MICKEEHVERMRNLQGIIRSKELDAFLVTIARQHLLSYGGHLCPPRTPVFSIGVSGSRIGAVNPGSGSGAPADRNRMWETVHRLLGLSITRRGRLPGKVMEAIINASYYGVSEIEIFSLGRAIQMEIIRKTAFDPLNTNVLYRRMARPGWVYNRTESP